MAGRVMSASSRCTRVGRCARRGALKSNGGGFARQHVVASAARRRGHDVASSAAAAASPAVLLDDAMGEYGTINYKGHTILASGLQGKALEEKKWPTQKEVMSALPKELFVKDTAQSLMYAAISTSLTLGTGLLAAAFIPLKAAYTPLWILYAIVNGTIATGAWVVAHECGHNAFSDNKTLQDTVGYILHSALLVPYFSWQRSHAVHHMRTNHLSEGETHVPKRADRPSGGVGLTLKEVAGKLFGVINLVVVLGFGWPAYLLFGASGGPVRGKTNHFNPKAGEQGKHKLFPGIWGKKVWQSDVGIVAMAGILAAWVAKAGSAWPMLALYMGPYLIVNAWLVGYTWLQHTDVDVPHFDAGDWTWSKGTFMTIDRPYGPLIDFLHHRIGSTHVAHHVSHQIPHYNAKKATECLKEAFPDLYLFDPTPIHKALWRINNNCVAVRKVDDEKWVYTDRRMENAEA